jgi:hypothetical protein
LPPQRASRGWNSGGHLANISQRLAQGLREWAPVAGSGQEAEDAMTAIIAAIRTLGQQGNR